MCPPRRPDAFIANSKLTRLPTSNSPSEVTFRVWFIASASKPPASVLVAVRQTPLTATESPEAISEASEVAIRRCAPSEPAATDWTSPTSWISPVNTSPLLEAGRDQHILAHRLCGSAQGASAAGRPTAEQDRGDEGAALIDLVGFDESCRKSGATLEEEAGDAAAAEVGERRIDA